MSENVERNPDEGLRVGRRLTAQGSIAKSILINNAYLLVVPVKQTVTYRVFVERG